MLKICESPDLDHDHERVSDAAPFDGLEPLADLEEDVKVRESDGTTPSGQDSTEEAAPDANMRVVTRAKLRELIKQTNAGDQQALRMLRRMLDACPQIWQTIGNVAAHSELALVKLIGGNDRFLIGCLWRQLKALKHDLAGPSASILERLAAERVAQCWLQQQYIDTVCAKADGPLAHMRYWAQRQDQAHRRYMSAMKSLTMIRAMLPQTSQTSAPVNGKAVTRKVQEPERTVEQNRHAPPASTGHAASRENGRAACAQASNGKSKNRLNGCSPHDLNGRAHNRIKSQTGKTLEPV